MLRTEGRKESFMESVKMASLCLLKALWHSSHIDLMQASFENLPKIKILQTKARLGLHTFNFIHLF